MAAAGDDGPVQKKLKYGGKDAGEAVPVDKEVGDALDKAEATQSKLDKINEDSVEEILQLERKYQALRRPLYLERNAVLRGIPKFWGGALHNHPVLSPVILDRDAEVLEYLTDLDVEDFEDLRSGFSISFTFAENPFFKNKTLVKKICFDTASGSINTECTPVEWAKEGGEEEVFTDDNSGLMNWFLTTEAIESDVDEVAQQIRDSLFVEPVKYYSGDVSMDEYGLYSGEEEDSDEEGDGGEGEDGDEEDGDEEDDEDEDGDEGDD